MTRLVAALALALTLAVAAGPAAAAPPPHAPQPPLDRSVLKNLYQPIGFFKPGDPLPSPLSPPQPDGRGIYNPSGHFSAYDTDIYETLNYPLRQANDESESDPLGSGDPRHGFCAPSAEHPEFNPYGKCPNHSLEYIAHFERTMKEILGDFGVITHRYAFDTGEPGPRPVCCGLSADQGKAVNPVAIIPGADNPEQMIVFGAHFDQTDTGPASFWDSAEGHATMPRIARVLADYWRQTGTRPSATIVFVPWDQEEVGTLGSQEWLDSNVPPDAAPDRIRGYFNDDPCAVGFPAFYHGNPAVHVPIVLQLSDPSDFPDPPRAEAFNAQAVKVVDEFWEDIDDMVDTAAGPMPVFTPADRDQVVVALGGLLAFGSDYSNFDAEGVPIFNMFADILGPHADGSPGFSSEGISILHTPRDNATTWSAFTSADQSGMTASDGYMTGMEMCAHLHGRFMLQPNMGGAQVANLDPLAYFEALPNEATVGKRVSFDAGGSHQLASVASRALVPDADLQYKWTFGDGSPEAFGKTVKHVYRRAGTFKATLTLTNRDSHVSDSMAVAVTVLADEPGNETDPAGQNADPGLRAKGSTVACQSSVLGGARVRPAGARGLNISLGSSDRQGTAEVWQVGSRKNKRIARFAVKGAATWNGRGGSRAGTFFVRVITRGTGSRPDSRAYAFARRSGKFRSRKPFQLPDTCDGITVFRLTTPGFGGRQKLGISFVLREAGRATVTVYRGKRRVKTFRPRAKANKLVRVSLSPKRLRRGEYKVVLKAAGKTKKLYAVKR